MPTSERGDFENPTKSAYSVERYDSSWERQYMKRLERDKTVAKWTKNHGITIQYVTEAGNVRGYRPDFLLERIDGAKELHEVKGSQFINNELPPIDWTLFRRFLVQIGGQNLLLSPLGFKFGWGEAAQRRMDALVPV